MMTDAHQEESSSASFDGTTLPRSIRWRLQLGLLRMPTETSGTLPANTAEGLLAANKELLATQRDRYDHLILQYDGDRFQSFEDEDDDDEIANAAAAADASDGSSSNLTDAVAALDPLSLMVHQQDMREEKEARQ
jgi:hypothetical protein